MCVEPGRGGAAGHLVWILAGLITALLRHVRLPRELQLSCSSAVAGIGLPGRCR
jgi:hypothetical protein